ncbi:Mu transposase C-terminal domain-containing protein [Paratissierella segnis]|uniref:DDE-type integrase/transposase/recombinase n=1 Tax=Paratissierella segnis TaxID=2763679 RepID=A0A926IEQ0_9FIRM|nr:Mu transposase C-terminal domain-containing protein [Paratissierella segnis]MBC8587622.1 DDE-type integrase/transposase/recombinase [Paratissierella segnis]
MLRYTVNSLLEWKDGTESTNIERLLWMDDEIAYTIDVNKNKVPYIRRQKDIEDALAGGKAEIKDDDEFIVVLKEQDIPEKHKKIRDRAWEVIRDMVDKEPDIFQSAFRGKLIKRASETCGLSESWILEYLKRYWKRGKTCNALLPDYRNCGAKGKERKAGNVKRGRPRTNQSIIGEGVNVTEEIKRIFRIAVNKYYYTTAKNSLTLTYELMRKEYFSDGFKEENGVKIPIIKPQAEIPSFGQFRYWFEKERNIKKEITSRYSNKKYQKQYRPIIGSSLDGVFQPGQFEIDCQVGDVYLVSRFNRNWVIGRPAIYAVIDKFSRLICGLYIGLETGSYAGAMMALLNATMNKVEFCKQYGIKIEEKDWPVHHLPETIIADRGELEGGNIDNLINILNVKVQNTPPYRADLKSAVERFFGLTNERVKPFLPGKIDLEGRERGDNDYRTAAKLDLHQFTQIMIKCILYHNNHYHLDYYKRDQDMLEDNVSCIPIELWNWGIANRGGMLRTTSEDVVKLALMPSDIATVTPKGIRYKDMYYTSKSILKSGVFADARTKGLRKIKISYDPRNMEYIYVYNDNPSEYEKCFLVDASNRYKDRAIEEIEYLLAVEKMQRERNKDNVAQAKTQLIAEIEDIVQQAEEDYKSETSTVESDRQRVKNIRGNRNAEKTVRRLEEVFDLGSDNEDYQSPDKEKETLEMDTLELLLKKQKEVMRDEGSDDTKR